MHYPPDTQAAVHWLRLRQRQLWAAEAHVDEPTVGALLDSYTEDQLIARLMARREVRRRADVADEQPEPKPN